MKKVFLVLLLLILLSEISSFEDQNSNLSHYIGGAAGISTGFGLSYRYWPEEYGWQMVFTPMSDGADVMINLGLGALKTLHETTYTRLFLYLVGNGTYNNYEDYDYGEMVINERKQTFESVIGIGPGLEIYLFNNIVIDIMFGFKYGFNGMFQGLGFTAETALYYRF